MNKLSYYLTLCFSAILCGAVLLFVPPYTYASGSHDEHGAEHEHQHANDNSDSHIEVTARMQQLNNIAIEIAGAHTLVQKIALFGVIKAIPTTQFQVRPAYPGTIQHILVQQGDSVSKGQLLATITNSSTLKQYAVHAPAAGVISERFFNDNELIRDEVLLRIVDYSKVYVELSAFPDDIDQLRLNMPLTVFSLHHGQTASSNISYIAPQMTEGHIARARAVLDNPDGYWRPGMHIKAQVQSGEIPVALAVRKSAIQRFRNMPVVFARYGNTFEVRVLEFGRQDDDYIEVLSGLKPGTEYATANSFVLKADVLKSGASHAH